MTTAYQTDNGAVLSTAITSVILDNYTIPTTNNIVYILTGSKSYVFYSSTTLATAQTVYNNLLADLGWSTIKTPTNLGG